jgi:hypothetical protein
MKIQNAPLDKKQLDRIKTFILGMNNKMACKAQTGIDTRTIDSIIKRKWASIEHIEKLMEYCDGVEGYKAC